MPIGGRWGETGLRWLPEDHAALDAVAKATGVDRGAILGKRRFPSIVRARFAVFAALRDRQYSYPEIAALFGVHHVSVMHGVRRHRERVGEP